MAGRSKKAIYAALFGNLAIALVKLVASIFTGSTAMWAETYHSAADTFNQVLILIGIKTSQRAASDRHPFGHGKEQFFWSFLVATLLFGISGILSFDQGISSMVSGNHHIENINLTYLILGISAVFEGNSLRLAYAEFRVGIEARGEKISVSTLAQEFRESKDPSILTIIVEDSAALLGIAIAAAGIFLTEQTGNSIFDSLSSLAIGGILMVFAFFLARENKALLIGEGISKREYRKIVELVLGIPEVNRIVSLRSMHFSPQDALVAMEVNLKDGLETDKIELVIDRIEQQIRQVLPYVNPSKIYIELEQDSCRVDFSKDRSDGKPAA